MQNVPILIIGDSGSGKSTMINTLNPTTTLILNTEQKPLPFKNVHKFRNRYIGTYREFERQIVALETGKMPRIKTLVLDSLTSIVENIDLYCDSTFVNYDKWKQYNLMVVKTIKRLKVLKIRVMIMGIPENKEEVFGDIKQYLRIKGKELKYGFIEKEFMVVLFTKQIYDEDGEVEDVHMYHRPNKFNTAKAPKGMFPKVLKNDAEKIFKYVEAFYKGEDDGAKTTPKRKVKQVGIKK